jgi:hypothetical protein
MIMLATTALHTSGQVATLVAFFANAFFVVVYAATAAWWRTPLGWNIMGLEVALTLALLPATLHYLFGVSVATNDAFGWLVVAMLAAVAVIVGWRTIILLRLQLHAKEKESE